MKHLFYLFLFSITLISFTSIQCTEKVKNEKVDKINPPKTIKKDIDPAKAFKEYITKYLNSYEKDKRERVTLLGGGWVTVRYEPEVNYKIDVQKTNSLLTPFIGYCEFTLTRHFTAFHREKENAIKDTTFIKSKKIIHKHHYGFQENKWVVTSRTNKGYSSWYDCNEVLLSGPEKGITNINGCWEK